MDMPTLSVIVQEQIESSALYAEDQENDFSSAGIVLEFGRLLLVQSHVEGKTVEQEM